MKPRADLPLAERQAFVAAFEHALRVIPSVRRVQIGRRVVHGAHYESLVPDAGDYLAVVEFDDLAGLQTYLEHPAHQELGTRFYQVLSSGLMYDYNLGGIETIEGLVRDHLS
jgi:hypothetical protein